MKCLGKCLDFGMMAIDLNLLVAILLILISSSALCQDLNSERDFQEHLQWNRIDGSNPKLLSCRVAKGGDLQCVADLELKSVVCEAFHFSKKTPVRVQIKKRAFTCEGTRLDHDSLLSQWNVNLIALDGAQSIWRVDSADHAQMNRIYQTELESLDVIKKQRNFYLSLGSLSSVENPQATRVVMTGVRALYGSTSFVFGLQFLQTLSLIPEKRSDALMSADFLLSSSGAGKGWLAGLEVGHKRWGFESESVRCLNLRYRWNPGSWRSQLSGGHCWYPNSGVNWAPLAEFRMGRLFWGNLLLEAAGQGVYRISASAFPQSGGLETRLQLSASFELFPE